MGHSTPAADGSVRPDGASTGPRARPRRWSPASELLVTFVGAVAVSGLFMALVPPHYVTDVDQYRLVTEGRRPTWGPFGARVLTPVLARAVRTISFR